MVDIFIFTFISVILPIFIQIAIGFCAQKKFKFDLRTLSKTQMYIFIPVLVFYKIYHSDIGGDLVLKLIAASLLILIAVLIIAFSVGLICRFKKNQLFAFVPTVTQYNSGNFCIPLLQLLYNSDPFVMSIQAVMMTAQNITQCTVGVFFSSCGKMPVKKALLNMLKLPIIYACLISAILKGFNIPVWQPIMSTAQIMSGCLVPLALFTLGAQLAQIKINFSDWKIYVSNLLKLTISPLVALAVVNILHITGQAAQAIIIITSAPSAVNTLIIAMEYDNEVEFTSKTVFSSTVLSAITVTIVICLVQMYIPV